MDIGNALGAIVALAGVYLTLSLMASVAEEFVAGAWNSRGQRLHRAIGHLLGDPRGLGLAGAVYRHPLIAGLTRPGIDVVEGRWLGALLPFLRARRPSYLPPALFADAICDILSTRGAFDTGSMAPALAAHWRAAAGDRKDFHARVAAWFTEAVGRESGAYKRSAQRALFVYGFALAMAFNVDSLSLATHLWSHRSDAQVQALAAKAERMLAERGRDAATPEADMSRLLRDLAGLDLPIGWTAPGMPDAAAAACAVRARLPFLPECGPGPAADGAQAGSPAPIGAMTWLGWLLTALAVSMGAQFWFDLLGKVVALRSSGRRPAEADPRGQAARPTT